MHSNYLPLPWKGRIGYACLNTYLRFSNPPVFASRTCRIASILENRHPLTNVNEPPHATKNRPDRDQPADVARGQAYVESLGLANARDVVKMLRWNDKYGIKFMRLSSEMFPFCSHKEYGYKLAPFAAGVLADIGKVAADLGHRLTTHPGQVIQSSILSTSTDCPVVHSARITAERSHRKRHSRSRVPCRVVGSIEVATTTGSGCHHGSTSWGSVRRQSKCIG